VKRKFTENLLWVLASYVFVTILSWFSGLQFGLKTDLFWLLGFAVTIAFMQFILGWRGKFKWGIIFFILIALHEFGHILAANLIGIETKGFAFYGILGGANIPDSVERWKDFMVAFGGPFLGTLAALGAMKLKNIRFLPEGLEKVTWFAIVCNLLNLLPIYPLDGGRMLVAIGASINPYFINWLFITTWVILLLTALVFGIIFKNWSFGFFVAIFSLFWGRIEQSNITGEAMGFAGILTAILIYIGFIVFAVRIVNKFSPNKENQEKLKNKKVKDIMRSLSQQEIERLSDGNSFLSKLTRGKIIYCQAEDALWDVIKLMRTNNVWALVVKENDHILGYITEGAISQILNKK